MKNKSTLFCLVFAVCTNTSITVYAQPGTLDLSFGNRGRATSNTSDNVFNIALAIQDNGKFLVAGTQRFSINYWIFLSQVNTDGTVDKYVVENAFPSNETYCRSMAIQSDGKILVGGYDSFIEGFLLLRYNKTTLLLDSSFNSDGIVSTDIGDYDDESSSLAVQKDGKIIQAGTSSIDSKPNFALVRYKTNGSLDKTFGTLGKVVTSIGNSAYARSVAIQTDGKILVAGSSYSDSKSGFALVRYKADGSLDKTFGKLGKVVTSIGNSADASSIAIQRDGKILVAGSSYKGSISCVALVRYNCDGSLDNSFGKSGKVITHVGDLGSNGSAIAIQEDGKIVVAGSTRTSKGGNDFATIRYNRNGSYDNTFSSNGQVITNILKVDDYPSNDNGRAVAIQADGKIVVAGSSYVASYDGEVYSLVRYNGDKSQMFNSSISQNTYSSLMPNGRYFSVYPNPAKDILHVQASGNAAFTLTDQSGKILLTKNINGKGEINFANLNTGIYYLRNKETGAVQKIIVER